MLLRPRQKIFVERSLEALDEHGNALGVAPTGCHAAGTAILMFDGTIKNVEDVRVGDLLMGKDSKPRKVLELHHGLDDMFEIKPIKGEPFIVNRGHILSLVRTTRKIEDDEKDQDTIENISVENYLSQSPTFKHQHKLYRARIDFSGGKRLPLDPYFLGILLGDGGLKTSPPNLTTADPEIIEACHDLAERIGLRLRIEQIPGNEANTYHFVKDGAVRNPLSDILRSIDVYGKGAADKHIPHIYKTASKTARAAILAGLLDTDGYLHNNNIEFSTASKDLADDVAFIARSLGFQALPKPKVVKGKTYYRFFICGDFSDIPLRVARRIPGTCKQKKNVLRTGFTVHEAGHGEYFGFSVDGDNLYLLGDFTVTHNSGKTIMLSAVVGDSLAANDKRACVLAHRDELTSQNSIKFSRVNPNISTSIYDAAQKSWDGRTTFAMVPTLARPENLARMPRLDMLVIDEAHHAIAGSYQKIIKSVLARNEECKIFGVTATPMRGDRKGLRPVFSNISDQITLEELIKAGHLVPPRTFVVDVGVQDQLRNVKKVASDFDMGEVDKIMNKLPVTASVIKHWKEKAGKRKTIVFCSTVNHARSVYEAFLDAGVKATLIHGELTKQQRKDALKSYEDGDTQVVVNVAVLTEGYDYTPTSCVVLLRPSSFRSTMTQMVGRGLRTVDPAEYPGIIKTDCIVLDFGTSTILHGSLEQDVSLDVQETKRDAPKKDCPECGAIVPASARECSLCGYEWLIDTGINDQEDIDFGDFAMTEIDIFEKSSFLWCDIFNDGAALVAQGFNAWGGVFFLDGRWYAIGGGKHLVTHLLALGERLICLAAANDWINQHESADTAHKSKRWISQPATNAQRKYLPTEYKHDYGLTRYHASALMTFKFNKKDIHKTVFAAQEAA